jgi:alkanesulfonate monooxygenase SsuD/methylene tetrahydromethanopterin reductase-like flavin-dependent oxidoreductase (luciferase family)
VRRKLDVLRGHCEAVGRDYDSILKTKLTRVIISEDRNMIDSEVERLTKQLPPGWSLKDSYVHGTPEQVEAQVEDFVDAGVQYMITSHSGDRELASLKLFGEKVLPKF